MNSSIGSFWVPDKEIINILCHLWFRNLWQVMTWNHDYLNVTTILSAFSNSLKKKIEFEGIRTILCYRIQWDTSWELLFISKSNTTFQALSRWFIKSDAFIKIISGIDFMLWTTKFRLAKHSGEFEHSNKHRTLLAVKTKPVYPEKNAWKSVYLIE